MGQLNTVENLNDYLYKVSTELLADRQKLSRWIAGVQQGFSVIYITFRKLQSELKELELLKEFFASRIETLKLRIEELLNEKEDMMAVH